MENMEENTMLRELVEYLTTCGTTDFDKVKLKNLKILCRRSDENVKLVFNELITQLHKKHSEIRLSTIYLVNDLFMRSHVFRELVIDDMQVIIDLTVKKSLPPPKYAAKLVKEKTQDFFMQWHGKYAESYIRLALAKQLFPTPRTIIPQQQIQNNSLQMAQELKKLEKSINDSLPEIIMCVCEIESCFSMLVPRFDEEVEISSDEEVIRKQTNVPIEFHPHKIKEVVVKENEDNEIIIGSLKERIDLLQKNYLKKVLKWKIQLSSYNNETKNKINNVLLTINGCLQKYKDLKVLSDSEEEFEEVPNKEFHILMQKIKGVSEVSNNVTGADHEHSTTLANMSESFWTPHSDDNDTSDSASYSLVIKNQKYTKIEHFEVDEERAGSSQQLTLNKIALVPCSRSDNHKEKSVRDAAVSSLTSRSSTFVGEFKPVKWSCRAPMPNGKPCPRMDRLKCPFHGPIIPRNPDGLPSRPEDANHLTELEKVKKMQDWQDPKLLEELKAKTGIDLKMPEKGKRKRKKIKYENLTDISKPSTSKIRLQRKILTSKVLKKKNYDKF